MHAQMTGFNFSLWLQAKTGFLRDCTAAAGPVRSRIESEGGGAAELDGPLPVRRLGGGAAAHALPLPLSLAGGRPIFVS